MSNLSVCRPILPNFKYTYMCYGLNGLWLSTYILHLLWILLKHHFYFISYKKVQIMISKMDLDGSVFFYSRIILPLLRDHHIPLLSKFHTTPFWFKKIQIFWNSFFSCCFFIHMFNLISWKNRDVNSIRCNSTLYNLWGKSLPRPRFWYEKKE